MSANPWNQETCWVMTEMISPSTTSAITPPHTHTSSYIPQYWSMPGQDRSTGLLCDYCPSVTFIFLLSCSYNQFSLINTIISLCTVRKLSFCAPLTHQGKRKKMKNDNGKKNIKIKFLRREEGIRVTWWVNGEMSRIRDKMVDQSQRCCGATSGG